MRQFLNKWPGKLSFMTARKRRHKNRAKGAESRSGPAKQSLALGQRPNTAIGRRRRASKHFPLEARSGTTINLCLDDGRMCKFLTDVQRGSGCPEIGNLHAPSGQQVGNTGRQNIAPKFPELLLPRSTIKAPSCCPCEHHPKGQATQKGHYLALPWKAAPHRAGAPRGSCRPSLIPMVRVSRRLSTGVPAAACGSRGLTGQPCPCGHKAGAASVASSARRGTRATGTRLLMPLRHPSTQHRRPRYCVQRPSVSGTSPRRQIPDPCPAEWQQGKHVPTDRPLERANFVGRPVSRPP